MSIDGVVQQIEALIDHKIRRKDTYDRARNNRATFNFGDWDNAEGEIINALKYQLDQMCKDEIKAKLEPPVQQGKKYKYRLYNKEIQFFGPHSQTWLRAAALDDIEDAPIVAKLMEERDRVK